MQLIGRVRQRRMRLSRICFVSSFPPRKCGIATFTKALIEEIDKLKVFGMSGVIAVNEPEASYNYDERVKFEIQQNGHRTYRQAAEFLNNSRFVLSDLQHEFGLWGGKWGEYILTYLEGLDVPNVTTFHTVLDRNVMVCSDYPEEKIRQVVTGIAEMSARTIVMTKRSRRILMEEYGIPSRKVRVISHGVPSVDPAAGPRAKAFLGLSGKLVLLTCGLIGRGKGIEYVIKALPKLIKEEPRIIYLIVGETHPEVKKREGESYRNYLGNLVKDLGLTKYVRFDNRYLSERELTTYLEAADIYLAPYLDESQSSSGTLSYAMGSGTPVIATPFVHALEALGRGRGILCRFRDPESIADAIIKLLNPHRRRVMGRRAYEYAAKRTWSMIAEEYVRVFKQCIGHK